MANLVVLSYKPLSYKKSVYLLFSFSMSKYVGKRFGVPGLVSKSCLVTLAIVGFARLWLGCLSASCCFMEIPLAVALIFYTLFFETEFMIQFWSHLIKKSLFWLKYPPLGPYEWAFLHPLINIKTLVQLHCKFDITILFNFYQLTQSTE